MHQICLIDVLAYYIEQLKRELKKAVIITLKYSSEMHIINYYASKI